MKALRIVRNVLIAYASALTLWSSGALAQTKIDVSIFHSEGTPWTPAIKWWAQEVEAATEGRVNIRLHFSGSLVSVSETLKAVRNGAVPAGLITSSSVSGQLRYMGYTEAAGGLPTDPDDLRSTLNALRPVLEKNLSEVGVEYLWSQTSGELIALCHEKFLKTPADWKGVKVRAAGRWQSAQVSAAGGSPLALDPSEIYLALQNGTADCTLSATVLAPSLKLEQVAPKVTLLRQSNQLSSFVINKKSFSELSERDRSAIKRVSAEAEQRSLKDIVIAQRAGEAFFAKTGDNNLSRLTNTERDDLTAAFASALAPLEVESGAAGRQVRAVLNANR